MKENIIKLTYTLNFLALAIAAFSAPLFFLTLTPDPFEFNKFSLLLTLSIISVLAWSLRMVLQKKFSYTRSPLDIPFIILIAAVLISSFSSIDQYISIFGTPGHKWLSLTSLSALVAFYFSSISSLKSKKHTDLILIVLSASTVIASIIGIFAYFGIFAPFDFAKFRTFNTLGSPIKLALLDSLVLPLTLSAMVFAKNIKTRIASVLSSIILAGSLILINFTPAYIGLLAGCVVITAATLKTKLTKESLGSIFIVATIALLIAAVRLIPPLADATIEGAISDSTQTANKSELPRQPTLDQQIGWNIAASTIANPRKAPFGTGPGTFPFVYTQLKPRTVNNTANWPYRFEESSSEFTQAVATTGIVGALAYLFLIVTAIRFAWTLIFKSTGSSLYLPVASSIISGLILGFFTPFSISTVTVLFIGLICLVTLAKIQDEKHVQDMVIEVATLRNSFNWLPVGDKFASLRTTPSDTANIPAKSQALPVIFLIAVVITSIFNLRTAINSWRAENLYKQALLAANRNDGGKTIEYLQAAIRINPHMDTYHRVFSQTALAAAINLNQKKDPSQDERNLLAQLAQAAIEQAKIASGYQILPLRVPGISAANVANWETLSNAYQAVMPSIQGADINALNTLTQALALDPQNPILHDQLGLLHQRLKNTDLAQRKFEDSIVTKSDYGPAYYHLAKLLILTDPQNALKIADALNASKRLLPQTDPAIADIEKNLTIYNKKVEELKTSGAQPSVEASPSPSPSPTATPKAGAKATPSPASSPIPNLENPAPSPGL